MATWSQVSLSRTNNHPTNIYQHFGQGGMSTTTAQRTRREPTEKPALARASLMSSGTVKRPAAASSTDGLKRGVVLRARPGNADDRSAINQRQATTRGSPDPLTTTGRNAMTPTPTSKLPQPSLTRRVSKLALNVLENSTSQKTASFTRTRKLAIPATPKPRSTPATPPQTATAVPPVTAIRIRKPAIARPASVILPATQPTRQHARTSSVSTTGAGPSTRPPPTVPIPFGTRGVRSVAKPAGTSTHNIELLETIKNADSNTEPPLPVPARRSTRLAKTSSESTGSVARTPPKQSNLPSRRSLSYASPSRYSFLNHDPNHTTPQRLPKTSTQPYEELKARWLRTQDEAGSPGMLLADSPIAKLRGEAGLDDMDDRDVELELLRRELEEAKRSSAAQAEATDLEKVALVQQVERLNAEALQSKWKLVAEMAQLALEEEKADAMLLATAKGFLQNLRQVDLVR